MSSTVPRRHYTNDEYVALDEASNVKLEFYAGDIYAMAGGTPEHAALCLQVGSSLNVQLEGKPCRVYGSDLRIRVAARNALWHDDGGIWRDTIGKSPRKARAYNELGLHVLNSGDPAEALRIFGTSLNLNPYQPPVYINLGLALEKTNQIETAVAAYERAIYFQPADPTAYYNLGVLYYASFKDRDSALRYFLKARDLDPNEPDVHQ